MDDSKCILFSLIKLEHYFHPFCRIYDLRNCLRPIYKATTPLVSACREKRHAQRELVVIFCAMNFPN